MNKLIAAHVLSFIAALVIALIVIRINPSCFIKYDTPSTQRDSKRFVYINFTGSYQTELIFRENLKKHAVLVFGSSELGMSNLPAIPYNFFAERVHYPCYAFGHEGNQDLCMLAQFAAFNDELREGKLVIMLSPGWFSGKPAKGASLQSFLEFVNERFLYYIWYDPAVPKEFKNYIGEYIVRNYTQIESPSAILRLIYYSATSEQNAAYKVVLKPVVSSFQKYCDHKREKYSELYAQQLSMEPLMKQTLNVNEPLQQQKKVYDFNFDSLYAFSKICFNKVSYNNSWGVENSYFSDWFPDKKQKVLKVPDMKDNQEYTDCLMLLKLFKYYHCRPLFIMQPLNPYAHANLKELEPTIQSVLKEIKRNGFDCYNMFSTDTTAYEKGVLNDVQHLGNTGWYRVDKKIIDYFSLKNEH